MSGKVLIATYNKIYGIPLGWYEKGNVLVYAGDYGHGTEYFSSMHQQVKAAKEEVLREKEEVLKRLQGIEKAYVYVGMTALNESLGLISELKSTGIEVVMVACNCQRRAKTQFAKENSVKVEFIRECGGRMYLAELLKKLE